MRLLSTYLLENREIGKPGSLETDLKNARYNTPEDFRKAMEELKATFPEFGAVSDDPVVVVPHGFPRTITIQVGLHLVVNFAYADAVRIVVSNRTVVPHLETTKDVTKLVKITIKSKIHSGGTGVEGISEPCGLLLFVFFTCSSQSFFFLVRSGSHAYIFLGRAIFSRFAVFWEQAAHYSG